MDEPGNYISLAAIRLEIDEDDTHVDTFLCALHARQAMRTLARSQVNQWTSTPQDPPYPECDLCETGNATGLRIAIKDFGSISSPRGR